MRSASSSGSGRSAAVAVAVVPGDGIHSMIAGSRSLRAQPAATISAETAASGGGRGGGLQPPYVPPPPGVDIRPAIHATARMTLDAGASATRPQRETAASYR